MAFADIRFFAPHGIGGPVIMAVGEAADALASQGFEVTKDRDDISVTYAASDTVLYSGAGAGDVGRTLIDSNERKAYRVTAFTFSTDLTLDRTYEGPAGAGNAHLFDGPSGRAATMNPQRAVKGGIL